MALVVKDRVKETTATTGTGTLTLAGAVSGFQTFATALSDADTTYYAIREDSTGEWEVGLGTFTASGTLLSRDTILESSNAGSAINLTVGSAEVFITYPAEKSVYLDGSGDVTSAAGQIDISNFNNDSGFTTNTGTVTSVAASAGTGISVSGSPITTSGTLTITNTAPDQTVVLTEGSNVSITGTYPNFTIASTDQFTGTVTSVAASAGTGISISGSPITTSGTLTITNTAPDQTVVLTEGSNVTITGTYPNFTIASTDQYTGTVTSVGGTGTVNGITLTGTVTTSGNLTLGGTLSNVDLTTQVTGTLPVANGGTGITSLGTGVATWLGTPSSSNLAAAVTDETGSGALVFGTVPTLTRPAITGTIAEDVYALSGTSVALDPDNGSIQTHTLTGNTTYTDSFAAGEAMTVMIDDGTDYTITWPTMTWVNNGGVAPTLATSGYTVVALWKVSTTLYGALVGDGS